MTPTPRSTGGEPAETKSLGSFARFFDLPLDVRLLIWEFLLPSKVQDLKIGCHNVQKPEFFCDTFMAPESMNAPETLLSVCRESREVALTRGSFVPVPNDANLEVGLLWVNRRIRVLYMTSGRFARERFQALPLNTDIQSIVCLWPGSVQEFRRSLTRRFSAGAVTSINTVYIGLSAIVYDDGSEYSTEEKDVPVEPIGSYPLYDHSGFAVVGLEDPRLPALMEAAHEAAKHRKPVGNHFNHRTTSCFVENLRNYWENSHLPEALQMEWLEQDMDSETEDRHPRALIPSPSNEQRDNALPKLKPAILFGRSKKKLFYGSHWSTRLEERQAGLLFTKYDVHTILCPVGSSHHSNHLSWFNCEIECGKHGRAQP